MFSGGVRTGGITTLQSYNIAEGVPLSRILAEDKSLGGERKHALDVLTLYEGSSALVNPDPNIVVFCEFLVFTAPTLAADAQEVLNAIAADIIPISSFDPATFFSGGIVADTDYEVSLFTYNVGTGQTTHNFHQGTSILDPLITTFTTAGNQNDYSTWVPGITLGLNSGATGEIVVTIHAPDYPSGSNFDSRLTLSGISVVDPSAPTNSAPVWTANPVNASNLNVGKHVGEDP